MYVQIIHIIHTYVYVRMYVNFIALLKSRLCRQSDIHNVADQLMYVLSTAVVVNAGIYFRVTLSDNIINIILF